jgi:hypothetical protein
MHGVEGGMICEFASVLRSAASFSAESSGRSSVGSYRSVYVKCDRLREANINRHKHRHKHIHKHRLFVKY